MSRSSRATPPSRCRMSTAPRNSSCAGNARTSRSARMTPHRRNRPRTSASTALTTGPKTVTKNDDRRRDQQRHAVGIGDGDRLGQNFAENHDQRGHDDGGVDDALIADRRDEHVGGESRGGNGDELSPQQHRADQASAHRDRACWRAPRACRRPSPTPAGARAKPRSAPSRRRRRTPRPRGCRR